MSKTKKATPIYSPAWCDIVLELGRSGLVLSSYATKLGLSVSQMQAIAKARPDFSEAIEIAMSYALAFHEEQLALAQTNKGGQPQLTLAFLKSNYPAKYNIGTDKASTGGRGDKQGEIDNSNLLLDVFKLFHEMAQSSLDQGKTLQEYVTDLGQTLSSIEKRGF